MQAEKATARTPEEREIAHQRRKAKEAEAKMNMHVEKAEHAAEKQQGKHHILGHSTMPGVYGGAPVAPIGQTTGVPHQQPPLGAVDPVTGTTVPTNPLGGHHHGHKHL